MLTALAEQLLAPRQLGEKRAKRLKNRLNELRAVQNVSSSSWVAPILEIGDTHG